MITAMSYQSFLLTRPIYEWVILLFEHGSVSCSHSQIEVIELIFLD